MPGPLRRPPRDHSIFQIADYRYEDLHGALNPMNLVESCQKSRALTASHRLSAASYRRKDHLHAKHSQELLPRIVDRILSTLTATTFGLRGRFYAKNRVHLQLDLPSLTPLGSRPLESIRRQSGFDARLSRFSRGSLRIEIFLFALAAFSLLILGLFPGIARSQLSTQDLGGATESLGTRIFFERQPHWIDSAAWSSAGNSLVAVDSLTNRILRLDLDGRNSWISESVEKSGLPELGAFYPLGIRNFGDQLLLELTDGRLYLANEQLQPLPEAPNAPREVLGPLRQRVVLNYAQDQDRSRETVNHSSSTYSRPDKIWQFATVRTAGQTELIGFADIVTASAPEQERDPNRWTFSYFATSITSKSPNAPPAFRQFTNRELGLTDFDYTGGARTMMRLGYPFIASTTTVAYILHMDQSSGPTLLRYDPSLNREPDGVSRERPAAPSLEKLSLEYSDTLFEGDVCDPFRSLPDLPSHVRFRTDYPLIMQQLEWSCSIAGLYADRDTLYFLLREPHEDREQSPATRWRLALSNLEASADDAGATVRISNIIELPDIRANHLTVVPGQQAWAFIEKGRVEALFERQPIPSMYVIASNNLRTP